MPWSALTFSPGVNKDVTRYGSAGTWVDSNLIHFRNGFPERWGGWVRYLSGTILDGVCRSLHRWSILTGYVYLGIGTNRRFYVASDDVINDVSPLSHTSTLANPFATTIGSPTITVTDAGHTAFVGTIIEISGASAVGGITMNGEWVVTGFIDNSHYQITAPGNASSTATGGGASVSIAYVFSAGTSSGSTGISGWGIGAWGLGAWGTDGGAPAISGVGMWSQDNWGEDLVACAYDNPIFYWDATNPTSRMVNIRDLPGADGNAPTMARFIVVSHRDRHLLAFGVGEEFGGSQYAPMTVRWCSQENIFNWNEADETGTAGSLPLSSGSRFIAVQPTQAEIIAWSDAAMYSIQFVGSPDVYISNIIATNSDIAGVNASVTFGSGVYWIGRSGFYYYDGRVQKIPSTVWDYVERDIDWSQANKIFCCTNKAQDEVTWYYTSLDSPDQENDHYVSFDVNDQCWNIGRLSRSAWLDADFQFQPTATSPAGMLFYHDFGMDDGSVDPPVPLDAYIESAPVELSSEGAFSKGDRFAFVRRILPDVTFLFNDGANVPQLNLIIKTMNMPGGGFGMSSSSQVSQTAIVPVEEFTTEAHVRLRGRSITIRYESNTLGSQWRIGVPRFDIRTDGQR